MANTVNENLHALEPQAFAFNGLLADKNVSGSQAVTLELARPHSDILTFALFARDFSKDQAQSGADSISIASLFLIFSCVIAGFF